MADYTPPEGFNPFPGPKALSPEQEREQVRKEVLRSIERRLSCVYGLMKNQGDLYLEEYSKAMARLRMTGDSQVATLATNIMSGIATALRDLPPAVRGRIVAAAQRASALDTQPDEEHQRIARSMLRILGVQPDQETGRG